jgi:hypothetical protein
MNCRERITAILKYDTYDKLPILHFGFWQETLEKWVSEGHLKPEEIQNYDDGSKSERNIAKKLGFDANYFNCICDRTDNESNDYTWYNMPLFPPFENKTIRELEDGSREELDRDGVIGLAKDDVTSIPAEIDHTLKDRKSWEEHYLPRLKYSKDRLDIEKITEVINAGESREEWMGVYCGSLYGKLRNYWGLVELSYLQMDDDKLYTECIDTIAELSYQCVKNVLETGAKMDFAHYWEDICFKGGPLINPNTFDKKLGRHYRRISDLCGKYGVDLISVDCDGYVDDLVPVWLDNGVNVMFPIEKGSWEYDFETMRKKFGKELRGVGNMDKVVLSRDKKAVDKEIVRLQKLVDLGGYLPCPDHRIAPDAEWGLVAYYCEQMRKAFNK